MKTNNQNLVAETKKEGKKTEDVQQVQLITQTKKTLTPYQNYKNSRNQNGKKYFEFYNDVKVYTHNIWDW